MSDNSDFLSQAWEWAINGAGGVPGLPGLVFENFVFPALGTALIGAIAYRKLVGVRNKAINITKTVYSPSGIINPKTGEEFIDQRIVTLDNDFNFYEAFRGAEGRAVARAVEKATRMANERLRTLQKVRYEIGADRAEWLWRYAPNIPTGHVLQVAQPQLVV